MNLLKKIYMRILSKVDPIRYAIKVGVNISPDSDSKLISTNFGSEPWLISIGKHVEITNGVYFITHDGATWVIRDRKGYEKVRKFGKIAVEDNCFIGMNSIILPGVTIGPNSIVAAGSVVTKNVAPNTVVAGNPAKFIYALDEYAKKCLKATPDYNEDAYRTDRKKEILKMLE